jgi:hypothetical protein
MKKNIDYSHLLIKFSFLFPLLFFCFFLFYFAVDVPQGDDFELVLHFLSNYFSTGNDYLEKLSLLTAQFVEHRLFYTRLVVLLQYLLTGQVSFYLIIVIGNLSLIGILVICWRQLRLAGHTIYYLLPISLLLFQPCYSYDGVLWPAATLAYNSVSFFAILTIHWLSGRRKLHFGLAVLSAMLCTYTFGNGILILFVGIGLLIVQKRWKELLIWTLIAAFIAFVYFVGYEKYETRNNPLSNLSKHTIFTFINILVFLGSALNWNEVWPKPLDYKDLPSIIGGGLILITYGSLLFQVCKVWFTSRKINLYSNPNYRRHIDFLIGCFSFFVFTGVLLCISRVDNDQILMHINRYRIHSVVSLILVYLTTVNFLKVRINSYALAIGSIFGYWILSFFHFYGIFAEYNRVYKAAQHNWVTANQWFIYRDTSYWEEASKLAMNQAKEKVKYQITESPFQTVMNKEESIPNLKVENQRADKMLRIMGDDSSLTLMPNKDFYISFKNLSLSKTFIIPAFYDRRSIKLILLGESYYYPHFFTHITYKHFPTGKYQVGIATEQNKVLTIRWQPFTFDAVQESNITH